MSFSVSVSLAFGIIIFENNKCDGYELSASGWNLDFGKRPEPFP